MSSILQIPIHMRSSLMREKDEKNANKEGKWGCSDELPNLLLLR